MSDDQRGKPENKTIVGSGRGDFPPTPKHEQRTIMIPGAEPAPKKRPTMPGINVTPTPQPQTIVAQPSMQPSGPTPKPPNTSPQGTPLPVPVAQQTIASSGRARRPSEG